MVYITTTEKQQKQYIFYRQGRTQDVFAFRLSLLCCSFHLVGFGLLWVCLKREFHHIASADLKFVNLLRLPECWDCPHAQPTWLLVVEMLFLCKKQSLVSVLLLNTIFNTLLGELIKELWAGRGHQIGERRESLFFKVRLKYFRRIDIKVDRK